VRLHLFSKDEEQAVHILEEINMTHDGDTSLNCPKCGSSKITRDFPKQSGDSLTFIFFGVLFPHKKVNHCLDCDSEF
jgi:hypothetical protein